MGKPSRLVSWRWAGSLGLLGLLAAAAPATSAADREAFRVCADPNSMPMSHRNEKGYENKLAELFAGDLGVPVEYTWYPQRFGFGRNTLLNYDEEKDRYKCDVVMGVTSGFDFGKTTEPYYRSIYTIVYARGRGFDQVKTPQDLLALDEQTKQDLRIGAYVGSPGVTWLLRNGFADQAVYFQQQTGDYADYAGRIIEDDLAAGDIDFAIVWGPVGGYYAKKLRECDDCRHRDLVVVPMQTDSRIQFSFGIAMATRYGEDDWLETLEGLTERNTGEVRKILLDYNVPLIDEQGNVLAAWRRQNR